MLYFFISEYLVVIHKKKMYFIWALSFNMLIILNALCAEAGSFFFFFFFRIYVRPHVTNYLILKRIYCSGRFFPHVLDCCKYISYSVFWYSFPWKNLFEKQQNWCQFLRNNQNWCAFLVYSVSSSNFYCCIATWK